MNRGFKSYLNCVKQSVFRRKEVESRDKALKTELTRCLKLHDIILIGLGHTLGSGLYVVIGQIAKNIAGPATVLSIFVAALAAINIGLCYAEFSSRVPWAGSAYAYAYITIGEILAFLVGWNVVLECVIALSTVSITWSHYLDSLLDEIISKSIISVTGEIHSSIFSRYPDIVALSVIMLITVAMTYGAKTSLTMNNILTVMNLTCILLIIISGVFYVNIDNWKLEKHGGFMPYGFSGVIEGAAISFYAFIGFELIASTAEEVSDPCKTIPKSFIITVIVVSFVLMSTSTILTLLVPYYEISEKASFVEALAKYDLTWIRYIVTIGALAAMTASIIGSMYGVSRILYAMSFDGMINPIFSHVSEVRKVPVFGIMISGVISSLFACFVKLDLLVELLSIGCLFAFTVVNISLIILRYTPSYKIYIPPMYESQNHSDPVPTSSSKEFCETNSNDGTSTIEEDAQSMKDLQDVLEGTGRLKLKFNKFNQYRIFDQNPGVLVTFNVFFMTYGSLITAFILKLVNLKENPITIIILVILFTFIAINFAMICMHQQNPDTHYFRIPFVPFIPTVSMILNIILMVNLKVSTWIRFVVWVAIGLVIYFGYSVRHTKSERIPPKVETESSKLVSGETSNIKLLWKDKL